jgi:YesN/AraC family two-component response regulator
MNFIRNNFNKGIALEDVSNEVGLNASYFSKLFKNETGESYTDYLNRVRVEGSKQLLSQSNFSLVDIAQLVGFNDQSYFTKMFKKVEGVSPGKFRKISPKNQRFY